MTLLTLCWEMPDALAIQREGEGDERGVDRKGERRMRQESELREEGVLGGRVLICTLELQYMMKRRQERHGGDRWARVRTGEEKKAISKNEQNEREARD